MDRHLCPGGCRRWVTDFACSWCWWRLPDRLRKRLNLHWYDLRHVDSLRAYSWYRHHPIPRSA